MTVPLPSRSFHQDDGNMHLQPLRRPRQQPSTPRHSSPLRDARNLYLRAFYTRLIATSLIILWVDLLFHVAPPHANSETSRNSPARAILA